MIAILLDALCSAVLFPAAYLAYFLWRRHERRVLIEAARNK